MSVCGDFGGINAKGEPCARPANEGLCPAHREDPSPLGRPTQYRGEYVDQVYKFCLLGATDEDLAEFFSVAVQTIHNWCAAHPDFLEARKRGKDQADARVADSLFRRALGYEHDAIKILSTRSGIEQVPYRKRYPPDTAAAIYWLNNRQRGRWSNRHLHEHAGKDGEPIEIAVTRRIVRTTNRITAPVGATNGSR